MKFDFQRSKTISDVIRSIGSPQQARSDVDAVVKQNIAPEMSIWTVSLCANLSK